VYPALAVATKKSETETRPNRATPDRGIALHAVDLAQMYVLRHRAYR